MNIPEKLFDAYADEMEMALCKFNIMGKMLDIDFIRERIDHTNLSSAYIYGGGYLGIQLYHAVYDMLSVPAIVDKNRKLVLDIKNIPVINLTQLKTMYNGEKIIITPISYYHTIREELLLFVPESEILFLGEFLGGIL